MSRTYKDSPKSRRARRDYQLSVRSVRKAQPDLRKLSRAALQIAVDEAEAAKNRAGRQTATDPATEETTADD